MFDDNCLPEISDTDHTGTGYPTLGWKNTKISFPYKVLLGVNKNEKGEPSAYLRFFSSDGYGELYEHPLFAVNTRFYNGIYDFDEYKELVNSEKGTWIQCLSDSCTENEHKTGEFEDFDPMFQYFIIYKNLFDLDSATEPSEPEPVAILPADFWQDDIDVIEENFEELQFLKINYDIQETWIDNKTILEVITKSDKFSFRTTTPDSQPVGRIFQQDTLGASLMHNISFAATEHRFTDQLINQAKIIGDAGMRYFEEMVEEQRQAIKEI